MSQTLKAVYRDGAFIPQTPCDIPEGAEVEITVRAPNLIPPKVTDPEERRRLMDELIQNMLDNPIPDNAPRLT
ncbi:MAG TPA: antitoxin family protein, partial [Pyrinomonadaceae bacterium]|nr:antitoxin family protein [Pyrinomonadaceae bacterium]